LKIMHPHKHSTNKCLWTSNPNTYTTYKMNGSHNQTCNFYLSTCHIKSYIPTCIFRRKIRIVQKKNLPSQDSNGSLKKKCMTLNPNLHHFYSNNKVV
jgi:hypothetical protein